MRALQVGGQLRQAVSSLESAKADNLALVERLRYVQGYRAQTRGKGNFWLQIMLFLNVFMFTPRLPVPHIASMLGLSGVHISCR